MYLHNVCIENKEENPYINLIISIELWIKKIIENGEEIAIELQNTHGEMDSDTCDISPSAMEK